MKDPYIIIDFAHLFDEYGTREKSLLNVGHVRGVQKFNKDMIYHYNSIYPTLIFIGDIKDDLVWLTGESSRLIRIINGKVVTFADYLKMYRSDLLIKYVQNRNGNERVSESESESETADALVKMKKEICLNFIKAELEPLHIIIGETKKYMRYGKRTTIYNSIKDNITSIKRPKIFILDPINNDDEINDSVDFLLSPNFEKIIKRTYIIFMHLCIHDNFPEEKDVSMFNYRYFIKFKHHVYVIYSKLPIADVYDINQFDNHKEQNFEETKNVFTLLDPF